MIYLLTISFTLLFVIYQKKQFEDDKGLSSGKWHPYGAAMRIIFFAALFLIQYFPAGTEDYILAGAINILLFELGINKIALNQPLLHVGTTAGTDKLLGKKKWFIYFGFVLLAAAFKIYLIAK